MPYGVQTLAVTSVRAGQTRGQTLGQTGHAAGQRELSAVAAATSGTCGKSGARNACRRFITTIQLRTSTDP